MLAWVTSENSTKRLECRLILTRSSSLSLDPHLMLTRLSAPVSGVDCPCPCPVANCLSAPLSNQLSSCVPLPLPATPRFQFQNPLSGFTPKQTKESSAWWATYIVLQSRGIRSFGFFRILLPFSSTDFLLCRVSFSSHQPLYKEDSPHFHYAFHRHLFSL